MSDDLVTEGVRLVEEAGRAGIAVRLLGGTAIAYRASEEARCAFARPLADLDLVSHRRTARALRDLLERRDLEPERVFNATHGAKRLLYHAPDRSFHIDVFLDRFDMSHSFDLADRIELEPVTLPAADLLLTKLQIAELNRKDASDTLMLLADHEPCDHGGPGSLELPRVTALCGTDWGLYTTITDNLLATQALLPSLVGDDPLRERLRARLEQLRLALEGCPKTARWKLRARVGRRVRWYEVPEEVVR